MQSYWIDVEGSLGVGITACSETDALEIFEAAFGLPATRASLVRSADELDQGHVIPNMGNWLKRGIWFPRGHEHISN
ncbi:MAG: hypothetical protein H7X93_00160 [Sphingomonadaceae bacterium]|nr:hypothetical protein [Sphingomonadaceae bacterium]